MAEPKTNFNEGSVEEFIDRVENEQKRDDSREIIKIMSEITGQPPKMWGTSIIGFGTYHYVYESGREGDWMLTGFSPRKQALTMYIMSGFSEYDDLLAKLGSHKIGKSCLYVKKLADLDLDILKEMITKSVDEIKVRYKDHN